MTSPSAGGLTLICGLPGAGKTTLAKRLERERNTIRLCPDDWIEAILESPTDITERDRLRDPIENLQWELCLSYLKKGFSVILENGFWSEEERSLYAMGAIEIGSSVELFYLETPSLDALWHRVEMRNAELASKVFVMTYDEVRAAWEAFEAPDLEETAFYDRFEMIPWVIGEEGPSDRPQA